MKLTKEIIVNTYNKFDIDTVDYIKEWADDNLSNRLILTRKPNPKTWDYPGDMGDGYFGDYEDYFEAVYESIVHELYDMLKDEYRGNEEQFNEEVALLFENNDAIYKAFPLLLTYLEYQEACNAKYDNEDDIDYVGFGYGEYDD